MSNEYRNNHYVPVWYQKGFLSSGQKDRELYYLDLSPPHFVDGKGVAHTRRAVRKLGFKHCFAENDLYATTFGSQMSTAIEKEFFGTIDRDGHRALNYFNTFSHPSADGEAFQRMLMFMSTQKLRTPKGLGWLGAKSNTAEREKALGAMLELRQLHCAIWTECVWQIADASQSHTKFIVSDHPVTVYNRRCGPRSQWSRGFNDPDIWFEGTHTIFFHCLWRRS